MESPKGHRIFLIPTDGSSSQIIYFVHFKGGVNQELKSNNREFAHFIKTLFSESKKSEEDFSSKDIWIPNFRAQTITKDHLSSTLKSPEGRHVA